MSTFRSTSEVDDIALRINCIIQTAIKKEITRTTLDHIFDDMSMDIEKSKQVIKILAWDYIQQYLLHFELLFLLEINKLSE